MPPTICQFFFLLSRTLIHSRFQVHPHGIWSQPLGDLHFTAFESDVVCGSQHLLEDYTKMPKKWMSYKLKKIELTCFCSNMQCGARLRIGIFLYPEQTESFHSAHAKHYRAKFSLRWSESEINMFAINDAPQWFGEMIVFPIFSRHECW